MPKTKTKHNRAKQNKQTKNKVGEARSPENLN